MAATTNANRGLRLDDDDLGEAQPWVVTHRGLQYPGEVMVADTVNPDWVLPMDGDTSFRIVLYTVPRRVPAGQIRDPRITMEVLQRLEWLAVLAPGIAAARKYLDGMTFDAERGELRLARDSLAARAAPAGLQANPSLLDSIEAGFTQLRRDYGAAYAAHRVRCHDEAAALATRLENLRPRVAAVARLNDVPEFGGPLGSDVPGRFGDLVAFLKSCELGGADLALEDAPYCGLCSLSLDEKVPRQQAERIIADLDAALREYNRRLSSEAVTRILAHPTREQLDRFIDLMRVSDLTELANVLDERVVEFLCGFVSDGRPGKDAAL